MSDLICKCGHNYNQHTYSEDKIGCDECGCRANILDTVVTKDAEIGRLNALVDAEVEKVNRMRAALESIANHPHNTGPENTPYNQGIVDGHRCAAEIAREGLK